jgi:hypothetical protein
MVLACQACEQHFISVFTETIDWADGDDPQYWQLHPITRGEWKQLCEGREPDRSVLESLGPARRCLHLAHPKGGPKKVFWSKGLMIGYHD